MADERVQRRLAAILAADVVGYSRLMGEDEAGTLAVLTSHLTELIEPCIAEHQGRVVKTTGDGLLAEFASVLDAVQCAVAFQGGMRKRNTDVPEDKRIAFRVGVNLGDVIVQDNDVYGEGVNIAARLEGLADPGGIVISDKVHSEIRTKLHLGFDDLGPKEVKNIADPVRVYRVVSPAANQAITASSDMDAVFRLPSIAVLPFANMSGDPEQEYFGDGVAEDLITALSRIRQFRVIARNSSFAYKHQSPDIRKVSQELGARYIVEGSVRKSGNRIRVSAQLIEGETGNHVWAQRYDRELNDIFAVQDELTETLVGAIEPEMKKSEQHRASAKATENLDAWELYHRGMHHLSLNFAAEFREARNLFRRAVRLDPNFGPAHAAYAEACARDLLLGSGKSGFEDAMAAARKAVKIDSEDPGGHVALGLIHLFRRVQLAAIAEFETAIRLNPSLAKAYNFLGTALVAIGRAEEALPHLENAIRLSPADPDIMLFHNRVGMAKFCLERYDEALEYLEAAARMPASNWPGRAFRVATLVYLGRTSDLPQAIAELREVRPDFTLSFVRERLPFVDGPYTERLFEGLRRAGLPE